MTTTTTTKTALSLNPVYMEVDQRGRDDKLVLVNADEVIDYVISPGHPNAAKLLNDFNSWAGKLLADNPAHMTPERAKFHALSALIEEAYGIEYVPEDDAAVSQEVADVVLDVEAELAKGASLEIAEKRLAGSER
ncbi:hypothetical protein [Sinorhizobium terangae]|uniref:hypothetical protein n=1 Tax=Sinorhizobium terangae TaxID=110322 RepID=UPI0024B05927|nr:hypothetical protein [Sinorhizobium terangae]WFU49028.1 hypothetical protein QA637_06390 [Sinorhizobium terangae]